MSHFNINLFNLKNTTNNFSNALQFMMNLNSVIYFLNEYERSRYKRDLSVMKPYFFIILKIWYNFSANRIFLNASRCKKNQITSNMLSC